MALDGTKIKANASKHKAMSYARMVRAEAGLEAVVESWLDRAAAADAAEDEALGVAARGDEMPAWVADKAKRLAKISRGQGRPGGRGAGRGRARRPDAGAEAPGTQAQAAGGCAGGQGAAQLHRPESRILKTKDGFIQGYNAQAAVDAKRQIIVAHALTDSTSDQGQLEPLIDAIEANLGRRPREISADAGYCSKANLEAADRRGIKPYIATGRQKHGQAAAVGPRAAPPGGRVAAMAATLRRAGRRSRYRLRKQTVEPVFGPIKQARGFRQFLLRGREKVTCEWAMICTAPQPGQARRRPSAMRRRDQSCLSPRQAPEGNHP